MRKNFAPAVGLVFLLPVLGLPAQSRALQVHQQLQGPFASTRDVIGKCLECHRQQAEEVLHSSHWTWVRPRTVNGKEVEGGKKDSLAGFAIEVAANGKRCMRCHISIAPEAASPETPAADLVDCLVCHDTTGQYRHAEEPGRNQPDLVAIARAVGRPTPMNCTGCHFADCGLEPSSRGDGRRAAGAASLDDVHLRPSGPAFTCQTCHPRSSGHTFSRQLTVGPESETETGSCASCHTATPHALQQLNQHSRTVSCQTCHIPAYAQGQPVLISWNWLLAGKAVPLTRSGAGADVPLLDRDGFWAADSVRPVYRWDDGTDLVYTRGQKIQPQELTVLQQPGKKSPASMLAPFRLLYGVQLYDSKYRYLISPLLQSEGEALFPDNDWEVIARKGMEAMVLPFSGQYGFTATAIYRRLNHGVAPASRALDCLDCHGPRGRINWKDLGFDRDPMPEGQPDARTPPPAQPPAQGQTAAPPATPPPAQGQQPSVRQPGAPLPQVQEPAVPAGAGR